MSLKVAASVIGPVIQHSAMIASMTPNEKVQYLKHKYNLTHGKGKKRNKRKKKK